MVYEWKPGVRISLDPQVVGETLEQIRNRNGGGLIPAVVVEEARPKTSVLHSAFEWDNSIAAELYRQEQARHLIRSIVVKRVTPEQKTPVRAFVVVSSKTGDGERFKTSYLHITDVMANPELREHLLRQALRELLQWRRRYEGFLELAEVFALVDKLVIGS